MNVEFVKKIANAVLYEGYILYPYRPSAVKNRQRFNFGVLVPQSYSEAHRGTESWCMQTECLALGDQLTTISVKTRFLHLLAREVSELRQPPSEEPTNAEAEFQVVPSLEVGGQIFQTWQEAVEREVNKTALNLGELLSRPQRFTFSSPPKQVCELLRDVNEEVVGALVRRQEFIEGAIELRVEDCGLPSEKITNTLINKNNSQPAILDAQSAKLYKITVRVLNLTPFEDAGQKSRNEALLRSLASAHAILGVQAGEFISLLDPPEEFKEAAASCVNQGTWPVLAGEDGTRDLMLSSPIILYDYPQVAPESAGDLCDGAEIDEILLLRILTLTEEEKREMRDADDRARQILERAEQLSPEQLMKLHGVVRSLRPIEQTDNDERMGMAFAGR
jgi:hydrogenase maturation protease